MCKDSLEEILEDYRPHVLASLKFQKFTLGTISPQFLGWSLTNTCCSIVSSTAVVLQSLYGTPPQSLLFIGVQMIESTTDGEIAMDVEVQWDGNPSIILAVGTLLGVALPIQVRHQITLYKCT